MARGTRIHYSAPPSVDLLPDAQRAEIQHERTLPKLLLALVATAAVAGLIWAVGVVAVIFACGELSRVESESAQLTAELGAYDEAQRLLGAVGSRSSDRQTLTEEEVFFIELRDEIVARLPDGLVLVKFVGEVPLGISDAIGTDALAAECSAMGAVVTVTVSSPGPTEALARTAALMDGVRGIGGYLCDALLDSRVVDSAEAAVTEVQLRFGFDETVRAGRFVEGDEQ